MGNDDDEHLQRQLYLLLISFGTAALVLALYHIIKVTWNHGNYQNGPIRRPNFLSYREHTVESTENSVAGLIPAHKFQKGVSLEGEDGLCAICLSDFEEGEELRTLPECLHSYHVQCIDMWFYSHSTCPVCRADAVLSVNLSQRLSEDGFGSSSDSLSRTRLQTQLSIPMHTT